MPSTGTEIRDGLFLNAGRAAKTSTGDPTDEEVVATLNNLWGQRECAKSVLGSKTGREQVVVGRNRRKTPVGVLRMVFGNTDEFCARCTRASRGASLPASTLRRLRAPASSAIARPLVLKHEFSTRAPAATRRRVRYRRTSEVFDLAGSRQRYPSSPSSAAPASRPLRRYTGVKNSCLCQPGPKKTRCVQSVCVARRPIGPH